MICRKHFVFILLITLALVAVFTTNPLGATPVAAQQAVVPTIPAPVAVTLNPATTAFLLLDFSSVICTPRPSCVAVLPVASTLLTKARTANAFVVYSDIPVPTSTILPELAPAANDPTVAGSADKFFGTNLDDLLKQKGIQTVVIAGYAANGAVLYTAFHATVRGYTVVVAEDAMGSEDPFAVELTRYQLLNQPGLSNPENKPLEAGRVTLSRSDLITFEQALTAAPTSSAASASQSDSASASEADSSEPKSLADYLPEGEGRDLLLFNCSTCHSPVCPVLGQRAEGHWERVKTQHRSEVSGLSDEEYETLFAYLTGNFSDAQPEPPLPDALRQQATCAPF
jgi:nicotinamidase-related amidase/cytochrome c5